MSNTNIGGANKEHRLVKGSSFYKRNFRNSANNSSLGLEMTKNLNHNQNVIEMGNRNSQLGGIHDFVGGDKRYSNVFDDKFPVKISNVGIKEMNFDGIKGNCVTISERKVPVLNDTSMYKALNSQQCKKRAGNFGPHSFSEKKIIVRINDMGGNKIYARESASTSINKKKPLTGISNSIKNAQIEAQKINENKSGSGGQKQSSFAKFTDDAKEKLDIPEDNKDENVSILNNEPNVETDVLEGMEDEANRVNQMAQEIHEEIADVVAEDQVIFLVKNFRL